MAGRGGGPAAQVYAANSRKWPHQVAAAALLPPGQALMD
jgi:hypothetical protein